MAKLSKPQLQLVQPGDRQEDFGGYSNEAWHPKSYFTRRDRVRSWVKRGAIFSVLASAAAYGLFGPSGSPTAYNLGHGETITQPFETTSIPGEPVAADVTKPEFVGLARPNYDSTGQLNPASETLYIGVLATLNANGGIIITPQEGNQHPVAYSKSQLERGEQLRLVDGATALVGIDGLTHNPAVQVDTVAGGEFPQAS